MSFFKYKNYLYPLIAAATAITIMVFGLVEAASIRCSYFLGAVFVWLCIFGCYKSCLRVLPVIIILGGLFFGIGYGATGDIMFAIVMTNRLCTILVAAIPGMSIAPAAITRNLSQLRVPRFITLGVLIMFGFMPILGSEIKRVREAMKTRGAGSVLNPRIFYRAFLIPFVTRLADISDTLSLSIETRGFTLGKTKYTVYKRETINVFDVLFSIGLTVGIVLTVVL